MVTNNGNQFTLLYYLKQHVLYVFLAFKHSKDFEMKTTLMKIYKKCGEKLESKSENQLGLWFNSFRALTIASP